MNSLSIKKVIHPDKTGVPVPQCGMGRGGDDEINELRCTAEKVMQSSTTTGAPRLQTLKKKKFS